MKKIQINTDKEEKEVLKFGAPESLEAHLRVEAARWHVNPGQLACILLSVGLQGQGETFLLPETTTKKEPTKVIRVLAPVTLKQDLDRVATRFGVDSSLIARALLQIGLNGLGGKA